MAAADTLTYGSSVFKDATLSASRLALANSANLSSQVSVG
jgi:hypothetical protein